MPYTPKYIGARDDILMVLNEKKVPMSVGELHEALGGKYTLQPIRRACRELTMLGTIEFNYKTGILRCHIVSRES